MAIYKFKKSLKISAISIFIFLAIIAIGIAFLSEKNFIMVITIAIGFIVFSLIFAYIPMPEIMVDDNNIKMKKIGKSYQECQWKDIYEVSTTRSFDDGTYITSLSYSEDFTNRTDKIVGIFRKNPVGDNITVTSQFTDYVGLLKEIKQKATNAKFDETTEKIIKEGIQLSFTRKTFWIAAILFFIIVISYLIFDYFLKYPSIETLINRFFRS